MTRIGLLSDTHGHVEPRILDFFKQCDEIWHAGDIGPIETADAYADGKIFRAVHGNIDDHIVRKEYPKHQRFICEKVDVWMTHIGGYPGRYDRNVVPEIYKNPPRLFITGHSHITKVINDPRLKLLHINPGAAGIRGLHKVITAARFQIDGEKIQEFELLEIQRDK